MKNPLLSVFDRYPIRGTFFGCCASADEQSAKSMAHRAKLMTVFLIGFLRVCALCYLITLSARNNTDCGMVRLSAFAVLRLMANSNLVGCSTGRSAGLAPLRILSTKVAARRNNSRSLAE